MVVMVVVEKKEFESNFRRRISRYVTKEDSGLCAVVKLIPFETPRYRANRSLARS